jgi:hypothetical protein
MNIKELKEIIKDMNDNDLVILSNDSEGNYFSLLCNIDLCIYKAESTYNGYIGLRELTPELIKEGYCEDDIIETGVDAIVLYPTN